MKRKDIIEVYADLVDDIVNAWLLEKGLKGKPALRDELTSEGYEYLIKAVDMYDPERGVAFHTYASAIIRGRFRNYFRPLQRQEVLPVHISSISDSELDKGLEELTGYKRGSFTLIDKYEPEGEVDKAIYHEIIMGQATYREVADAFGLTKVAIRNRIVRLKARLKKQMQAGGINYE